MPTLPSITSIIASTTSTAQGMFNSLSSYAYFEIGIVIAVVFIGFVIGVVSRGVSGIASGVSSSISSDPYRNSTPSSIHSQVGGLSDKGRIF